MNLSLLVSSVAQKVRDNGIRGTVRKAIKFARLCRAERSDEFDRQHGTQTAGIVPLWRLKIGSSNLAHGVHYEPSKPADLIAALDFLREDLSTFTFLDLGCGKGRILVVAAKHRFRRVVGVDFSRELAETAEGNLRKVGAQNYELSVADAAEVQMPLGNLVVYMYNPFGAPVMRRVVENLGAHRDGTLYVLYTHPRCADLLTDAPFLTELAGAPGQPYTRVWQSKASASPQVGQA